MTGGPLRIPCDPPCCTRRPHSGCRALEIVWLLAFWCLFSLAYEGSLSACADWYAAEDSKRSLCGSPELPVCVASFPLSYPKMVTALASPNDSLCPLKSANDRLHVCSPIPCHSLDIGVIVGLVSLFSFSRGCSQFFRLYGGRAISEAFNSSWAEVEALQ